MISELIAPMCMNCKNKRTGALSCTAFPDGIPKKIIRSELDHRKPVKGDHGILYDPISSDWQLPDEFELPSQHDANVLY